MQGQEVKKKQSFKDMVAFNTTSKVIKGTKVI